jgi:ATP-dependent Clp protease ATP-binding subunit ClpC
VFERFTDRARRAVVLALEEARFLNHSYIGTEHLLLGLIHEGEGVAAMALESLGISLEAVRAEVPKVVGRGKQPPTGHIPFTPRAKKVLELSLREAKQLGHDYIGTEHILLGLIREGEGVAAQVLFKVGASLDRVRQQVIQLLSGYTGGEGAAEPAGTRTRLVHMTVPAELREAEEQLVQVRREKMAAVHRGDVEQAAGLGHKERRLLTRLAEQQRAWTAGVDLAAVIQENQHLHREVERLRELLGRHGIEPDGGTTETA